MNASNMNKPSETDWARVDAMTDDMIDTSDIPPLTDEFFKTATSYSAYAAIIRADHSSCRA